MPFAAASLPPPRRVPPCTEADGAANRGRVPPPSVFSPGPSSPRTVPRPSTTAPPHLSLSLSLRGREQQHRRRRGRPTRAPAACPSRPHVDDPCRAPPQQGGGDPHAGERLAHGAASSAPAASRGSVASSSSTFGAPTWCLVTWCWHLSRAGNVLELMDEWLNDA